MFLTNLEKSIVLPTSVFVQIVKCICPNFQLYLSILPNVIVKFPIVFLKIAKCICPNEPMYLSKLGLSMILGW